MSWYQVRSGLSVSAGELPIGAFPGPVGLSRRAEGRVEPKLFSTQHQSVSHDFEHGNCRRCHAMGSATNNHALTSNNKPSAQILLGSTGVVSARPSATFILTSKPTLGHDVEIVASKLVRGPHPPRAPGSGSTLIEQIGRATHDPFKSPMDRIVPKVELQSALSMNNLPRGDGGQLRSDAPPL